MYSHPSFVSLQLNERAEMLRDLAQAQHQSSSSSQRFHVLQSLRSRFQGRAATPSFQPSSTSQPVQS